MKADDFQNIDKLIHEKGRMAIMSALASTTELSFTELKKLLNMTDGNLSVHIRNLQKAGYISVTKTFVDRKPHTSCSLTKVGKKAFFEYIKTLESIIKSVKEPNE